MGNKLVHWCAWHYTLTLLRPDWIALLGLCRNYFATSIVSSRRQMLSAKSRFWRITAACWEPSLSGAISTAKRIECNDITLKVQVDFPEGHQSWWSIFLTLGLVQELRCWFTLPDCTDFRGETVLQQGLQQYITTDLQGNKAWLC